MKNLKQHKILMLRSEPDACLNSKIGTARTEYDIYIIDNSIELPMSTLSTGSVMRNFLDTYSCVRLSLTVGLSYANKSNGAECERIDSVSGVFTFLQTGTTISNGRLDVKCSGYGLDGILHKQETTYTSGVNNNFTKYTGYTYYADTASGYGNVMVLYSCTLTKGGSSWTFNHISIML